MTNTAHIIFSDRYDRIADRKTSRILITSSYILQIIPTAEVKGITSIMC
jgi:hypothetical protein